MVKNVPLDSLLKCAFYWIPSTFFHSTSFNIWYDNIPPYPILKEEHLDLPVPLNWYSQLPDASSAGPHPHIDFRTLFKFSEGFYRLIPVSIDFPEAGNEEIFSFIADKADYIFQRVT